MTDCTWHRAAAAGVLALVLAGCGAQHASPSPGTTTQPPAPAVMASRHSVKGCTPASPSVFGFCIATYPQIYCCSSAYTGWSHIYVGASVDVRGSVPLFPSGKPEAKDVFIVSPSGLRTLLPVNSKGAYGRRIHFAAQGKYLIGLVASGPGTPWSGKGITGIPFYVAYRAVPAPGEALQDIFPAARGYPGLTVLAMPVHSRRTFKIRFLDAQGRPAANVSLTLAGKTVTTDAQGYADATYASGPNYILDSIYTGLFVQTYSRVAVEGGRLVGLPRYAQDLGPQSVSVIEVAGEPLVDISAFLGYGVADIFQGPPQSVTFDAASGTLTLQRIGGATLDTHSGLFHLAPGRGYAKASFTLHPVVQRGEVYLSLPDLARVLNLFAWASIQPDGSMLFSTFEAP